MKARQIAVAAAIGGSAAAYNLAPAAGDAEFLQEGVRLLAQALMPRLAHTKGKAVAITSKMGSIDDATDDDGDDDEDGRGGPHATVHGSGVGRDGG